VSKRDFALKSGYLSAAGLSNVKTVAVLQIGTDMLFNTKREI